MNRFRGVIVWRFVGFTALIALVLNYLWEMLQMPFYQGMPFTNLKSWLMCLKAAVGDMNITLLILLGGRFLFRAWTWWSLRTITTVDYPIMVGVLIAIGIEINAISDGRWSYSDIMPVVPIFHVGLVPLIQLMILPLISFLIAHRISSFQLKGENDGSD